MRKKQLIIIAITALICIYMISASYGFLKKEGEKKPIVKEKLMQKDLSYLYGFYLSGEPSLNGRAFFGDEDAIITIIAYIDLSSSNSKMFMSEMFPELKKNFIDTGKARFYHKNLITIDDYKERNERFIYVNFLECLNKEEQITIETYNGIINAENTEELWELAKTENASLDSLKRCIEQEEFIGVIEDISEVENYGISTNPTFYIGISGKDNTIIEGIPSSRRLQRTIKDYQILLGD